jgi:DNA-binding response OmpR family regulator
MTHVLIVEDDPQLLRALAINLRARHYDVDTAADGVRTRGRQPPAPRPGHP